MTRRSIRLPPLQPQILTQAQLHQNDELEDEEATNQAFDQAYAHTTWSEVSTAGGNNNCPFQASQNNMPKEAATTTKCPFVQGQSQSLPKQQPSNRVAKLAQHLTPSTVSSPSTATPTSAASKPTTQRKANVTKQQQQVQQDDANDEEITSLPRRGGTRKIGTTEEGAAVAQGLGGSNAEDPYAIEQEFVNLEGLGINLVGTDADLAEDYVAGLNLMATRCDPVTKMGYVDTVEAGHVLMVLHPQSVTKVLTTSVQHFLGGLRPPSAAFFGPKVLFILEGREWLDLRNVLKKAFQKHNVNMMASDTYPAAEKFLALLDKYSSAGQDLDFMRAVACFHIDAIGRVAFHADMGALDQEAFEQGPNIIEQSFEYLLEELPRRAYATDFETQNDFDSDTPDNRVMAEMSNQVRGVIRNIITARLNDIAQGQRPPMDLLAAMMDVFIEQYPEAKDDVEILTQELGDNLVEIIFAGYNTAVPTTCHALFFLASNPQVQDRLMAEIDEVLQGRRIEMGDLPKLPLLERVLMETLRLCPPASLISRQTTRDLVLEGVPIPRATRVWLPACFIHRDPNFWGQDADAFNPDRWSRKPRRGSFIPFADGARNCAGRNFAMWEMSLAITSLLQNFRIEPTSGYEWKTIFTGFGLRPFDLTEARVCTRLNVVRRE